MQKRWNDIIRYFVAVSLVGLPCAVLAGQWRVNSGVGVSERYSDNDNLSATDKKDKFVTVVSPDISLSGNGGGKITYDVLASLTHHESSDGGDSTNPSLNGNANAELIDQVLFFDVSSTINQNRVDPFRSTGDDDVSRSSSDNVTTTYSYTLSPYLVGRINSFANLELRYSYDEQWNSESDVSDSSRQAVAFNLNSGSDFAIFDWGLVGNYSKVDTDDDENAQSNNDELKSADLRLGYRVNRKLRLRGSVGREWNDFNSVRSDVDGERWDFGMIWTPNKRTTVDIGYGERFFGNTPTVDISYRRKKSVFTASYVKELTDARTLRSEQGIFDEDPFGNPIDPTTGDPIFAFPDDGQIVDERISFSWSRQGKRTTLTWSGDHSVQEPQSSREDVVFISSSLELSRRLTSKLSFDTSVDWENQENELGEEFETWRFNMGLSRPLGSKSNVSLRYTYTDRDSDLADDGYEENRVILNYNIRF
ncbi:MAG: TIGR03016 family PEP-CTERM system-associated outer membrane protein [Gammaproteobacteria bacterium]|nr:TIGR03016 family PEP-CTERM system-associated outer membrane protein [Gammaproteobacteria bacterium]MBQ0840795.1 TIGR03016 family PEP-CTERM system-associated outer membrane protein [Gammaproteobacteria bacterium]